jgi:hypothetical protein
MTETDKTRLISDLRRLREISDAVGIKLSDGKLPTVAQVIVTFTAHRRARIFLESFADKCKHTAIWKKVYTQPWIVDLEDEDIRRLRQPLSDLVTRDSDRLKAGFFRKRTP